MESGELQSFNLESVTALMCTIEHPEEEVVGRLACCKIIQATEMYEFIFSSKHVFCAV